MVEAASSDEDPGQVQDELRRLRLWTAGARRTQPTQRVGCLSSHVKASKYDGLHSLCVRLKVCEATVHVL